MVYIIILNWKNALDTVSCLNSIASLEDVKYRLVICDNASPDNSYEVIKDWLRLSENYKDKNIIEFNHHQSEHYVIDDAAAESVFLIQTGANLGYAGGNNVGIRFSLNQNDMEYVWILNNDTEVHPFALKQMILHCQEDAKIGVCGSRLVYFHDRTILQGLGGRYHPLFCTTSHYAEHVPSYATYDDKFVESNIDYVIGASMLIKRTVLKSVGLLSEDYFLYYEELDYCLRLKNKFSIGVATNSIVFHKEGGSTAGGKSDISDFFSVRNRLIITKKFNKWYLPTVYVSLLLCIANRIRRNEYKKAWNIFRYVFGLKVKF